LETADLVVDHLDGKDADKELGVIRYAITAIVPLQLNTGGIEVACTCSTAIDKDAGGIGLGRSSDTGKGMSGSGKGSVFPFAGCSDSIFDEYPGGIPVEWGGCGSPGIVPIEIEVNPYCLGGSIAIGKGDIGDDNVVGKTVQRQAYQEGEQKAFYSNTGFHVDIKNNEKKLLSFLSILYVGDTAYFCLMLSIIHQDH
jgi:hypothetical protein